MRFALDVQSTLSHKTGIGHYTSNLLDALRQVAPENEYSPLDWGHDPTMRLDRRLYWQQIELPRRARRAKADLLHVTGFDAPKFKPCPVVLTVHDLIGMLFPHNLTPAARFYWSYWLPHSIHWADALIADSANTRSDLQRLLKIPPERVAVIPLGINPRFHPPEDPAEVAHIRRAYDLPERFMLYTGTIEPRKGLDTLVEAFAAIAGEVSYHLIIAGKRGRHTEGLLRQILRHGLDQRVHMLGYVPDGDLPLLYAAAEVFVFPSRYEGFGLPPLEAMACGTPVICSNASSLPEVIGEAGLLVPPDDPPTLAAAIRRINGSPELRADLRARGLRQAAQYSWEATARQTLAVYLNLLHRSSPNG